MTHQSTELDRRAQIAQDVAARYGVPVSKSAVQIVPRGASAYAIRWDGEALRYVDNAGQVLSREGSRKLFYGSSQRMKRRGGSAADPAVAARREKIAGLVSKGLTDDQIAVSLGIGVVLVRADRSSLGIKGNGAVMALAGIVPRLGEAKDMLARGFSMPQVDHHFGWRKGSTKYLIGRENKEAARVERANARKLRRINAAAERAEKKASTSATQSKPRGDKQSVAEIEARRAKVQELLGKGIKGSREIAVILDATRGTITRDIDVLRRKGIAGIKPKRVSRAPSASAQRTASILELHEKGLTLRAICAELNLSIGCVGRAVRQHRKAVANANL